METVDCMLPYQAIRLTDTANPQHTHTPNTPSPTSNTQRKKTHTHTHHVSAGIEADSLIL